ncbi:transporter substrate-binding domain-containing protein [Pantoea sp. Mb-10]|uniref:transporter substrate-binding domain-containing protein n=1 Tax=unclassified Pantoea TaxID=2630326 RepID=UPI001E565958|nr:MULTISPECIES: transporter substrate-binding domain-containing protein [unclassified Pantoea]MCE0491290.1 transporter substrate-binding domain-containing protein [Pantoea sp. Mb-10]MCE0502779.1 transporter substrate-binding domain-containing protein [Pantoea sp. Pb-8]
MRRVKVIAWAVLLCAPLSAGAGLDVRHNETPIHIAPNPEAIARIPAHFQFVQPGYLTVATAANNSPPIALWSSDNTTLIGSDPDIARLLAESLGLKLKLVPAAWEDWPLGIRAGRYDVAMFNIAVTEARKQSFDFATYRADHHAFAVKADSAITAITRREDIAGKRIIVGSGTNQEKILLAWDAENRAHGLAAVQPLYLSDDASATLTLLAGRADATFGPQAMAAWKAASRGQTKVVGQGPYRAWVAVTTKKGNGLVAALQSAIEGAIQGGQYQQVLTRWGEQQEAVAHSQINPPASIEP